MKFNNKSLNEYCKENNLTLTKDYSEIKVIRDTIIHGICKKNCGKEFMKAFRRLVNDSGPICLDCLKNFTTFDIKYLKKYIEENKINIIGEYKNVTRDTKIIGKCNGNNCNNNFEKNFRYLVEEGGAFCKKCTEINKLDKYKDEMNKKYGCDYYLQSKENKEKLKNILIEKYGVEHISQNKEIRRKIEKTCIDKYGTQHPSQTQEIKDKISQTNLKRYGVKNPMQNEVIKNKLENNNLTKYGVKYALELKETHNKIKKTNLEKYGVEYVSQNPEIYQKMIKNSYQKKTYISKSGKEYICQGYEPQAIKYLIEKMNFDEKNILIGPSDSPKIKYKDDNNKEHIHYTDIYLKNENKILEVKSEYSIKNYNYKVFAKQKAAKEQGYLYEIWVMSPKGTIVEKHI
jgi:hypothetical protein